MENSKLKNVLTLSANVSTKKASKNEAKAIMERLISGDGDITDHEFARLYKYFLPTIPRKPKNSVDWLRKIVAKKDIRFYLNYLHVDDLKQMQATNGHMLAVSHNHDYDSGFYSAETLDLVDINARYPDINRALTSVENNTIDLLENTNINVSSITKTGDFAYVYNKGDFTIALRKDYADKVLNNPSICIKMLAKDADSGVFFEFNNGDKAVIMPVRL